MNFTLKLGVIHN